MRAVQLSESYPVALADLPPEALVLAAFVERVERVEFRGRPEDLSLVRQLPLELAVQECARY